MLFPQKKVLKYILKKLEWRSSQKEFKIIDNTKKKSKEKENKVGWLILIACRPI